MPSSARTLRKAPSGPYHCSTLSRQHALAHRTKNEEAVHPPRVALHPHPHDVLTLLFAPHLLVPPKGRPRTRARPNRTVQQITFILRGSHGQAAARANSANNFAAASHPISCLEAQHLSRRSSTPDDDIQRGNATETRSLQSRDSIPVSGAVPMFPLRWK